MTARQAAWRGVVASVLGATIAIALTVCVELMTTEPRGLLSLTKFFASARLVQQGGSILLIPPVLAFSAVGGWALGRFGRPLDESIPARLALLGGAAVLVVWFVMAATWVVLSFVAFAVTADLKAAAGAVLALLLVPTMGLILGAPILALPTLVTTLLAEGWTRPAKLPQTGLAHREVRRMALLSLAVIPAALVLFGALHLRT